MRFVATETSGDAPSSLSDSSATVAKGRMGRILDALLPLWNQDRALAYESAGADRGPHVQPVHESSWSDAQKDLVAKSNEFTTLYEEILDGPCSREVWSIALLDSVNECYVLHLRPLSANLGDITHGEYMAALARYFDAVNALCVQQWLQDITRARRLKNTLDAAVLEGAAQRMQWWKIMALNGVTLPVPIPTHSFIEDLARNVFSLGHGVYMVRLRCRYPSYTRRSY